VRANRLHASESPSLNLSLAPLGDLQPTSLGLDDSPQRLVIQVDIFNSVIFHGQSYMLFLSVIFGGYYF